MVRRPPISTLFPTRRSSDLVDGIAFGADGTLFGSGRGRLAEIAGTNSATPGAVTIIGFPFSDGDGMALSRSEEHTSELQSHSDLVCRLLLEKKKRENSDI